MINRLRDIFSKFWNIEAINIKSNGKYDINIESLMNNDGLIYKYGDGKYSIDIGAGMKKGKGDVRKRKKG